MKKKGVVRAKVNVKITPEEMRTGLDLFKVVVYKYVVIFVSEMGIKKTIGEGNG